MITPMCAKSKHRKKFARSKVDLWSQKWSHKFRKSTNQSIFTYLLWKSFVIGLSPLKNFLEISKAWESYSTTSPSPGLSNDTKHVCWKWLQKKICALQSWPLKSKMESEISKIHKSEHFHVFAWKKLCERSQLLKNFSRGLKGMSKLFNNFSKSRAFDWYQICVLKVITEKKIARSDATLQNAK